MSDLFLKTLNMSIAASWLILAVVLLRLVLKKASKWVIVLLWGIVAIKLICPFTIESPVSMIPDSVGNGELISEWTNDYIGSIDIYHPDSVHYDAAIGAGRKPISDGEGGYYIVTKHDQLSEPDTIKNAVVPVLSVMWVAGIIVLAFYAAASFCRLRRKVNEAVIVKENILLCDHVKSPFILGLVRPKIYLSSNMDTTAIEPVIAHEKAHLARCDHWWKPLGFLVLTVHWFNPLCWVAYVLLCRDIELACDEKVIRQMDLDGKKQYSSALLVCSTQRQLVTICPLAFGEVGVKERVKNVLRYKKPAFGIIVLAVAACAVVTVCFATSPREKAPEIDALRAKYPEYFELGTFKGLEVYVWQMAENDYRFGLMQGTNREKTPEEKMALKGATAEEMALILSTFVIEGKDIFVIPWQNPASSYMVTEDMVKDPEYINNIRAMLGLDGASMGSIEVMGNDVSTEDALHAYSAFLSGDRTLMSEEQLNMWFIPAFHDDGMDYEYTCLDLDRDGTVELLIQLVNSPQGYNGVFHFENGQIFCWNSDWSEGSCFDYPLNNGTMVRQYEFNGTRSYQLFQYKESGREEPATLLFAREELIPEDSSEPCPYYTIDGKEVDETEFDRQFALLVDGPLVERTAWTPLR